MTVEEAEAKLAEIDFHLSNGISTHTYWMDIEAEWVWLPKRDGGRLKRKGSYGFIRYSYNGKPLSRTEVITEVTKPLALRRALVDAQTIVECDLCGRVAVGKEASEAHQHVIYQHKDGQLVRYWQPTWERLYFYTGYNKRESLEICPRCVKTLFAKKKIQV